MKILITLIEHRTSDFGGAYLYTKEIYQNLCNKHEVYFVNGTDVITNQKIKKINYKLLCLIKFDLCIIMQSDHFLNLNLKLNLNHTKLINVIHSEVFECDAPLKIQNVKYVAVREEIKDNLIKNFDINQDLIKILYNPINENYHKKNTYEYFEYKDINYGIFACANFGPIRLNAAVEFSLFCKENKIKSLLVSNMPEDIKENMYQFYDKILEATPNINYLMKHAVICGGILKGRTYWEAKLLGKPVMEYMVDSKGEIEYEIYEKAPNIEELENIKKITNPKYVVDEIIKWAFD
jgi:hypothetical protein